MKITHDIAGDVGLPLGTAEHSWTLAVKDGAAMVAAIAQASVDARVPVALASEMLDQGIEGLVQLGAIGRTYAGLHGRLSALARKAGLDPSMYGQSIAPQAQVVDLGSRRDAA